MPDTGGLQSDVTADASALLDDVSLIALASIDVLGGEYVVELMRSYGATRLDALSSFALLSVRSALLDRMGAAS